MRRIASHYLYWRHLYRMYYLELDDWDRFVGVYPLEGEIAGTEFYDGTLIPLPSDFQLSLPGLQSDEWKKASDTLSVGMPVYVYRLGGVSLSAAELSTDNGCSNGYIERL